MAIALVQAATEGNSGDGYGQTLALPAPATAGNLLLMVTGHRNSLASSNTISGWTRAYYNHTAPATVDSDSIGIWAKVAVGGEQTISLPLFDSSEVNSGTIAEFSGFGGATITLESAGADLAGAVATYPALSPSLPGQRTVLLRVDWKKGTLPDPGPMTLSGWTLLGDSGYAFLGNRHRLTTFYLTDAAADVTYAAAARSSSGDGTDTGVVITAAAFVAPQPGVFVDWALDGPSDPIDDITGDVLGMSWRRGASYDHVSSPGPGSATLIVDNSTGKYNPDNSGGSLYGYLVPGRPVWCGALRDTGAVTGTGTVRGFFAGRITEIAPVPIPGGSGTAEIICEDALGSYRRASASVAPSQSRSYGDFRTATLDFIGESSTRRSLEAETDMMPFSAADTRAALGLLEELNTATGSRHFIAPADSKEAWYAYTVVNRLHKLASAADEAVNADDVTAISGYRVTGDTILNEQRASVNPIDFSSANETVWTYAQVPLAVTSTAPVTLWAEFAGYVFNAAVVVSSSGGTLTPTLTSFGTTAKLVLTVTGAAVTISSLAITGQALRRGDAQTIVSSTTLTAASQTSYGVLAGSDIATDLIGQTGHAQGVVDFIAWKFREPLKRPSITIAGKSAATLNSILDRDLFDVITLTVDRLSVVARRFEIIGIRGSLVPGLFWEVTWELQETPNQAATTFFTWDSSSWDGGSLWAPF